VQRRSGATIVEQVVILTLLAALAALAVQRIGAVTDSLAVHSAARDVRDVFATAREYAVASGRRTAVGIEPSLALIAASAGRDTVTTRRLASLHQVAITSSRDSMAYSPSGLGYGAANLRIVIQRHQAADTVTVSRLGRVR
jgi:Tfp pilus assembly protein FimT